MTTDHVEIQTLIVTDSNHKTTTVAHPPRALLFKLHAFSALQDTDEQYA